MLNLSRMLNVRMSPEMGAIRKTTWRDSDDSCCWEYSLLRKSASFPQFFSTSTTHLMDGWPHIYWKECCHLFATIWHAQWLWQAPSWTLTWWNCGWKKGMEHSIVFTSTPKKMSTMIQSACNPSESKTMNAMACLHR